MAAAVLKGQAPAAVPEPEGHEVAAVLLALVAEMSLRELVLVVLSGYSASRRLEEAAAQEEKG